ncbi:MAG: acetyl-CoA C-acyltransferase [Thermoanaerobaculia bacterium]|jgi:acetyl-CoA acyltransferase|nr:acetyl-CoA C-acyltransferase [Thermoanaerobaculia bacterium]MBP9822816.1 acetyl-CoA C-acyltransferase [Thermoanaerobaculia bacterium]
MAETTPDLGLPPAPLPAPSDASAAAEVALRADTVWTRRVASPGAAPGVLRISRQQLRGPAGRVAIVEACRTPFARAGSDLRELDVIDLAGIPAAEVVARAGIDPAEIDFAIFGVVVAALHAPNLGREILFRAALPASIPGTTVNLACASANRALTSGAEAILRGEAEIVLAGGAESLSNVPLAFAKRAAEKFMALAKARSLGERLKWISRFRPRDFVPVPPAIAEHSTGMTMGEACEKMAKENDISRRAQDEIALLSHQRAAAAQAAGHFAEQVVTIFPPPRYEPAIATDNGVRAESSMAALAALRPAFDRRHGTLTAGNSSPITDGGGALLLMSERRARALGRAPLGYLRSWAYAATDPGQQLLQGPAYAAPMALERAGLRLAEIDLVEMHEAFAAQVLSNLKAFASPRFARDELGRSEPIGVVDLDRLNVNGGSLALGHPFGATGVRVTMQLLHELRRRSQQFGLITVCAAGGHGFAMVVERE